MSREERERVAKGLEQTSPIAERLEEGIMHHETVKVHFRDGKEHAVEVWAISSKQFREAARKSHLSMHAMGAIAEEARKTEEQNKALAKEGKPPIKSPLSDERSDNVWDFYLELASMAVRSPPSILDLLLPNEEAAIALKAIEMSQPPKNSPAS